MTSRFYIPCLNGWRAISILLVMIFHGFWRYLSPEGSIPNQDAWIYITKGGYGVSIFFAISGYLITSRILHEYKKFGTFSLKEFYIKRTFRILPPFYFYLLVIGILGMAGLLNLNLVEFGASFFFLRIYLFDTVGGWYTGHFWSLCIEEHFYVILSSFFAICGRVKVIIPICIFLLAISVWTAWSFRHKGDPQIDTLIHFLKVFKYMDYMLWGCLFALLRFYFYQAISYLKLFQVPSFIFLFIILIFDFKGKTFIAPFVFGLTIYLTSTEPNKYLERLLESSFFNFIGKISYSLYLWQQLFFYKPGSEFNSLHFLQDPPVSIAAIFIMALVSYHYIEKPFIKMGHRYVDRRI